MSFHTAHTWNTYCDTELATLTPLLATAGFTLNEHQPHLQGERFLQQAVTTTSGCKLILFGTTTDGTKVVIKATRDKAGAQELRHERTCKEVLHQINFAATVFNTPTEIAFIETAGFTISITAFIEQPHTFLERPISQQFDFALAAFKAQEGAHATTYTHRKKITKTFSFRDAKIYLEKTKAFVAATNSTVIASALERLQTDSNTINQYSGFLTHTDFVPHNFRIDANNKMYLLDHSSLTFGNKHEGWARFLNFMTLHNPALEAAFVEYVTNNKSSEEQHSLYLMRLYRLSEIITYYTNTLARSEGNLLTLNTTRVDFWSTILQHQLDRTEVPPAVIATYQNTRDTLRTTEEKDRQSGLH